MKKSITKYTKEELELLSNKDITNLLLEEYGEMNTLELFTKITELLELPKSIIEKKIGDYFTGLSTDKRFILLDNGSWDLKSKHKSSKTVFFDEEDEEDEQTDEVEEDVMDYDSTTNDDDPYDSEEDLKDLVIIEDEEELE